MMPEAYTSIQLTNSLSKPSSPKARKSNIVKNYSQLNISNTGSKNVKRSGSFVVGQKLRESKWFTHNEITVFCAVVESGFIIELKNAEEKCYCGIAIWMPGFEKSKNPEYLEIFTLSEIKGKQKVCKQSLLEFWPDGTSLRINNKNDKSEAPLSELSIRNQIRCAENSRKKWHNTEHFAYYCRYGPAEAYMRSTKFTDQFKWNTETFFMKIKSLTIK